MNMIKIFKLSFLISSMVAGSFDLVSPAEEMRTRHYQLLPVIRSRVASFDVLKSLANVSQNVGAETRPATIHRFGLVSPDSGKKTLDLTKVFEFLDIAFDYDWSYFPTASF